MATARRRPTLADRAESIRVHNYTVYPDTHPGDDHAPRSATKGKGHRCERYGCDAEATRWVGAWRCETCPDPVMTIAAEESA